MTDRETARRLLLAPSAEVYLSGGEKFSISTDDLAAALGMSKGDLGAIYAEPCCDGGPAGHTQQEHHDASPCYDPDCTFDHPKGGPFPHPCDDAAAPLSPSPQSTTSDGDTPDLPSRASEDSAPYPPGGDA